jgi:hypothetical protein
VKRSLFALSCWLLAPAAFAILDTNSNGVSDFWEREFNNGNLFDEFFDPQEDDDSDGWTNAQEAEAGTNPFDPNPPDGMIRPVTGHIPAVWSEPDEYNEIYLESPETVTVSWPTLAGKQYTLFFSPDLTQGSWLPVGSPFIAYGGESTYYFDVNDSDKRFWRVSVSDVDSDYDGLANYEEILAGTNPYAADSDGDTISDWQEFMAGTNPLNQDTDGDGIPDPLDSDPLVSALAFADADGDGIPDAEDAAPNDPRGPAPSIAAENVSGNPLSNLIKDETVKFVLAVSNPAGPAPTASNLTFFLNGTAETESATITAIGSPVGSSQRFLLTWTAKTTANYPSLTLQNLTLRFRDSEQATSWLNLARIDVAEWEGKVITLPYVYSEEYWSYEVLTHLNGIKKRNHFVSKNWGTNDVYRGSKAMTLVHPSGGSTEIQLEDHAIPFLKISGSQGGAPSVVEQQDFADIATGVNSHFTFINKCSKSINVVLGQAGVDTSLNPGETSLETIDLTNIPSGFNSHVSMHYKEGDKGDDQIPWIPFFSSNWPMGSIGTNSRIMSLVNFIPIGQQFWYHSVRSFMARDVKITPHASGTVEYPGLPQESVTSEYDQKYMAISSEEWRKIVIKIYPPQQHFTYARGYRLNIGTGTTGDAAPQTGWMAQTQSGGTLTALTIPTDGKIEILATDTNLYPQLTSPEGLVLFIKRDASVDQVHILSLDILPIVETNNPVRLGALNILPVDITVDADRNGEVEIGIDQTSPLEPYQFWVNNDYDVGSDDTADDMSYGTKNYIDDDINDARDLEDFARIQIRVAGILEKLKSGEVQMVVKFRNGTVEGDPAINIFPHLDPDGGRDYVENESAANYHVEIADSIGDMPKPGRVTKQFGYKFGTRFWEGVNGLYAEATESQPTRYLLFEGAGSGKGELVVELRMGKQIIAEGGSCWLDLKDVKKMYEEYSVGDIHGKTWQQINEMAPTETTRDMTAAQKSVYQDYDEPSVFEYQAPDQNASDYEKDYILFVHGWRMKPSEKYAFAETAFKRLWHRGYRGRFGILSWPTEWTSRPAGTALWDVRNYDRSDRKAMLSATACQKLFRRLDDMYPGRVRVFAHSMGNVLVSEALKIEASQADARQTIHTYVACQAASVAHAYDAEGPEMISSDLLDSKPSFDGFAYSTVKNVVNWLENGPVIETYGNYPPTGEPLYNDIRTGAGNIVNFHNRNDDALAWWLLNQLQKPDGTVSMILGVPDGKGWGYANLIGDEIDGPIWFRNDGVPHGWTPLSFHNDTPEIHAHIAEANSPPLGAAVGDGHDVGNVISGKFDLMSALTENQRFADDEEDHSAEFRSINMRRYEFWDEILRNPDFFDISTDYPPFQ